MPACDNQLYQVSTFHSNLVASAINSTAKSLRNNLTFMWCVAFAPSGAVMTLASAIQNKELP
jgi:hypothetical protein